MTQPDPINPTDDAARQIAQNILVKTRFGALAVNHQETGAPYVARVAMLWTKTGFITLISTLSAHTKALQKDARCAVLAGEPEDKGDPLTHPRISLVCKAEQVDKTALKSTWLAAIPKAKLYYDFGDFQMFSLKTTEAHMNAGFGKAYRLSPEDLGLNG